MKRRHFLGAGLSGAFFSHPADAAPRTPGVLFESSDPQSVFAGSAGLARAPSGRLIATMNLRGPGLAKMPDIKRDEWLWSSRIYSSDDHGQTWTLRGTFPMNHARPFAAGQSLYILGHGGRLSDGKYGFDGDLAIMQSRDGGTTWKGPFLLTSGQIWHQAPCNVVESDGRVYLVMERVTEPDFPGWNVNILAPVLMSGGVNSDLTQRKNWVFSSELSFREAIRQAGKPNLIGVPFHPIGTLQPGRTMAPPGWLETNVVRFQDPGHVWHDPAGRTLHLWMRAHTGSTNLACIAKAVESADRETIAVSLEKAPSGKTMLFVPCPGGHMKFHIVYDSRQSLYWLLSSQSTDSMQRIDTMSSERHGLPNNERHILNLHFSRNCVDWCFATTVANTKHPRQARHYASMVIDGEDLHILSRSGDERARNAHDGNLITFHSVPQFRQLTY